MPSNRNRDDRNDDDAREDREYNEDDDRPERRRRRNEDSSQLTAVDWLICILCSGIGCIVGVVRCIQGNPTRPKMLGLSLLFGLVIRGLIFVATNGNQQQGVGR